MCIFLHIGVWKKFFTFLPLDIQIYEILESMSEVKFFFSVNERQNAYSLISIRIFSKIVSSAYQNIKVWQC